MFANIKQVYYVAANTTQARTHTHTYTGLHRSTYVSYYLQSHAEIKLLYMYTNSLVWSIAQCHFKLPSCRFLSIIVFTLNRTWQIRTSTPVLAGFWFPDLFFGWRSILGRKLNYVLIKVCTKRNLLVRSYYCG